MRAGCKVVHRLNVPVPLHLKCHWLIRNMTTTSRKRWTTSTSTPRRSRMNSRFIGSTNSCWTTTTTSTTSSACNPSWWSASPSSGYQVAWWRWYFHNCGLVTQVIISWWHIYSSLNYGVFTHYQIVWRHNCCLLNHGIITQ